MYRIKIILKCFYHDNRNNKLKIHFITFIKNIERLDFFLLFSIIIIINYILPDSYFHVDNDVFAGL